jgi:hypothetical protein
MADFPSNVTFVVCFRPVPVIVTEGPAGPLVGVKPAMVGSTLNVCELVSVAAPVVAVTGPVSAPEGTVARRFEPSKPNVGVLGSPTDRLISTWQDWADDKAAQSCLQVCTLPLLQQRSLHGPGARILLRQCAAAKCRSGGVSRRLRWRYARVHRENHSLRGIGDREVLALVDDDVLSREHS